MSTLTMPLQSYSLSLADPWTTADYTDITPFVKQWSGTVRGRQHELQLFQTGQVALTLEANLSGGRFSPWNTNGPYYNLLSADDGSQDASNGTWGSASNCTLAGWGALPPVVLDGPYALKITCNGSSPSSIHTGTTQYAVVAGNIYTAMASFLTSVTARACTVGIQWYNSGGGIISTSTSASVNDNTTSWTKATEVAATAPAGAVHAAVIVTVTGAANNEVHWICRAALFNAVLNVPNTAWAPGQRGLVPARPIKATATWPRTGGTTYPVFLMYVSNWTPQYGRTKAEQVINASDGLALLALQDLNVSAYANQVVADGATSFWRLNDSIGSVSAADIGSNNNTLMATGVQFGTQSPLLTDDATVAAMYTSTSIGTLTSSTSPTAGAQTVEFMFMMPAATTQQELLTVNLGGTIGYIFFSGGSLFVTAVSNGSGTTATVVIPTPFVDNGLWHHLAVVSSAATNGTIKVYLDGVLIGTGTASGGGSSAMFNGQNITFGAMVYSFTQYSLQGSLGNIAYYPSALTGTQVANHFALFQAAWAVQFSGSRVSSILNVIGWPASLQSIATGISQVQGATSSLTSTAALSYIQTVMGTEMGAFFCDPSGIATMYDRHYIITNSRATTSQATLANDGNSAHYRYQTGVVPANDDLDLWNDVPSQRQGGVQQRAFNALSIRQYRQRTLTGYTGGLQVNDAENLAQAQWLLIHYGVPITRVREVILSSVPDAGKNLLIMLGLGIFDNVTVSWLPIDGSSVPFLQSSLIESIKHEVTQSEWKTTWGLSPAETQPYLILNDAARGLLDSGNLIGY